MDGAEARIVDLLARGEADAAATAAIEAYGPGVLGLLCTLLDEEDGHDAFSLWAEDVWRGLPGFRRECSVRGWSYRLARNAAARFSRDAWRRRVERLPPSAASRLAASVASASALQPGGRRDRLGKLRAALAPEEQILLVLRLDRELEWEEVAHVLSSEGEPVTAPALRKRFERLREKLGRMAREAGLIE